MKVKTEKDYQEFARIGRRLGVPVFEAFLTLEVFDKHGKRTSYHKQRSHSWTRNAYNHLFSQLAAKDLDDPTTFGGGYLNIKKTNGSVVAGDTPSGIGNVGTDDLNTVDTAQAIMGGYRGPAGNDDYGIQVGTGTNAESFEDYTLQTKIASGNGAGELAYGEGKAHDETYTAGTKTYKVDLVRYFNNNSGGLITVNEMALVTCGYAPTIEGQYWLVARDKLGTGVEVADTGQLKVTYTISLVYAG